LRIFFKSNGKMGVTLVEILVSLLIGSLVMIPVLLLFGINEKVTYKSTNEVVACNLALQKIEELKSREFADLRKLIELDAGSVTDGPFKEVVLVSEKNATWNSPGVDYSRETRISFYPYPNPDTSRPDFELQKRRIRIRVIVNFEEKISGQKDRVKSFELATILGDETLGAGMNASFSANIGG
jgi:Tfp pilus assembly protein PilV